MTEKFHLGLLDHEMEYILDSNLVISFMEWKTGNVAVNPWISWLESHLSTGNKAYMLEINYDEVILHLSNDLAVGGNQIFPAGIIILHCEELLDDSVDRALLDTNEEFKFNNIASIGGKMEVEIKSILMAGFVAACLMDVDKLLQDKVVYATSNVELVECCLDNKEKRAILERNIGRHGLEHLINVRCIDMTKGCYYDLE